MELDFITHLRSRLPGHPLLQLGLGDDAAVLRLGGDHATVITVDMLTDGVDFQLDRVDPRRVGRKCLAVNLSDLAAMASRPLAAVVALALPRQGALDLAIALYEGLLPLAEQHHLALAGGDTNCWDGPLVVSVTALGAVEPPGPLTRSGARPGDRILVTGALGGSILGHHLDFEPRVHEAILLNQRYQLHAGIDVSDGLSLDLWRMAEESGCGALISRCSLPLSRDAHRWAEQSRDGRSALDHAMADGEDFELILAVAKHHAERILADQPLAIPITDIGEFLPERGLWQVDDQGRKTELTPQGWTH